MIIVPFVCNALQFWVIDNILKFNPSNKEEILMLKEGEIELEKKNSDQMENKNTNELSDI